MERESALNRTVHEILCVLCLIAASIHLLIYTASGGFDVDIIESTLGCSADPCVIKRNGGGSLLRFQRATAALQRGERKQVIIDGPCVSGCALFADEGRERVCSTTNASFGVHRVTKMTFGFPQDPHDILAIKQERFDQPLSKEFLALVEARGGLPKNGDPVWFSAEDVGHFIPLCTGTTKELKADRLNSGRKKTLASLGIETERKQPFRAPTLSQKIPADANAPAVSLFIKYVL